MGTDDSGVVDYVNQLNSAVTNLQIINFPNPCEVNTTFLYSIPKEGLVNIVLYNFSGEIIEEFILVEQLEGIHRIEYNASVLPTGIYFYKLQLDNQYVTGKMVKN